MKKKKNKKNGLYSDLDGIGYLDIALMSLEEAEHHRSATESYIIHLRQEREEIQLKELDDTKICSLIYVSKFIRDRLKCKIYLIRGLFEQNPDYQDFLKKVISLDEIVEKSGLPIGTIKDFLRRDNIDPLHVEGNMVFFYKNNLKGMFGIK